MNKETDFFLQNPSAVINLDKNLKMDKNGILNLLIFFLPIIYYILNKNGIPHVKALVILFCLFIMAIMFYIMTMDEKKDVLVTSLREKSNFILDSGNQVFSL
jgi:cbb3-type cytochrome oxidase subunit 3